jgi:hypothetical protein
VEQHTFETPIAERGEMWDGGVISEMQRFTMDSRAEGVFSFLERLVLFNEVFQCLVRNQLGKNLSDIKRKAVFFLQVG